MTDDAGPDWLFLMRHSTAAGRTTPAPDRPLADRQQVIDVGEALGKRLDEQFRGGEDRIGRLTIRHAETTISEATAASLSGALHATDSGATMIGPVAPLNAGPGIVPGDTLALVDPGTSRWWANRTTHALGADRRPSDPTANAHDMRAVLYVGHEPGVSTLVDHLIQPRWYRPKDVPALANGELLAVRRFGDRWVPQWTIGPSDPEARDAITTKVKAKLDVAKVFAPFVTGLLGFVGAQIAGLPGGANSLHQIVRGLSLGALAAAAVLYVMTLLWYDRLLMPSRYWAQRSRPAIGSRGLLRRPPSSDAWVLYQNMQRVWRRTFVPATWATGIGLVAFGWAARRLPSATGQPNGFDDWTLVTAAATVVVVGLWGWRSRPVIGVSD